MDKKMKRGYGKKHLTGCFRLIALVTVCGSLWMGKECKSTSFAKDMADIYSTEEFEAEYTYTGDDLGANWTREKTVFKVWALHGFHFSTEFRVSMIDEQMSSWAVISGYPEEEIKGAIEFLTYRQKISGVDEEKADRLENEYISVFQQAEEQFVNYQFRWEERLLNDFFNTAFPDFIQGNLNRAEFIEKMDRELKRMNIQEQE